MSVLPVNKYRDNSENFAFLRETAMQYIEDLASKLWTDYNIHDPGITLMEALCFAITDLGYRTSFDIKDIITRETEDQEASDPPIFTAREILTVNPWTEIDWRKLMVDTEGIHNAWLFVSDNQEVDFYADCGSSSLKHYRDTDKIKIKKLDIVNGKSQVIQDWIDHPDNVENQSIRLTIPLLYPDPERDDVTQRTTLILSLPGWEDVEAKRDNKYLPFINLDDWVSIQLVNVSFNSAADTWTGEARIEYLLNGTSRTITFKDLVITGVEDEPMRQELESVLSTILPDNVFVRYRVKLQNQLARLTEHDVHLRGLFDVLVEYDQDDVFGDLNSGEITYSFYYPVTNEAGDERIQEKEIAIWFPSWKDLRDRWKRHEDLIRSDNWTSVSIENPFYDPEKNIYSLDIIISYIGPDGPASVSFRPVEFRKVGSNPDIPLADEIAAIENNLLTINDAGIIGLWKGKLKRLLDITDRLHFRLHDHRNLCDDFLKIQSVCINDIGICADIDLLPETDLEEVQAQIFYAIEQYLSPPVQFYSLRELVDQNTPSEDIFDGPKLDHGFIKGEELATSALEDYRCIYASDIINILMDIPGVIAVRDLLMTKYDQYGVYVPPSERWVLKLDYRHRANFSLDASKLLFFKDDLPYVLSDEREKRMLKRLADIRAINRRSKLPGTDLDFPRPLGKHLDLADFTPLRHTLPEVYGITEVGLPETATVERKAAAKQLKAYLAFFDQILVNYLGQLKNTRSLFSTEDIDRTYFSQFLTEEVLGEALYVDEATFHDGGGTGIGSLQRLTESEETFLDRRNRFLDHLLARFAEQFTDYALLLNTVLGEKAPETLIEDKISFLEVYPELSAQRGKGFHYLDPARLWDTDNVPGLKKRLSRLLGMDDFNRQDLHCPTLRSDFSIVEIAPNQWSFELSSSGNDILSSPQLFPTEEEAFEAKEEVIELAYDILNYDYVDIAGQWVFQIGRILRDVQGDITSKTVLAESVLEYASEDLAKAAAEDFLQKITRDLNDKDCEPEGFHIVEHILLRPRFSPEDAFFEVCLPEDCFFCGEDDPYSFRATIIFPYWMRRFADREMKFREYIDRLARQEAPAHVHLKICWVSNEHLRRFEVRWRRWLEAIADDACAKEVLMIRLRALLQVLGQLRSVYYEGFLHDCDDSEEENTIILGKSFLGTFNPPDDEAEDETE